MKNLLQALFYIIVIIPFKYAMNIKAYGLDGGEIDGQMLVVANHGARLDAWVVLAGMGFKNFMKLHPFRIPIAKSIYDLPVLNILFRVTGMYRIESKGSLDESLESTFAHIDKGHSILFFPQGHMEKEGKRLEPKKGIAHIIKNKKINILPAKIMYRGRDGKNRGAIWGASVIFGKCIHTDKIKKNNPEDRLHFVAMDLVHELEKNPSDFLKKKTKQIVETVGYSEENVAHILRIWDKAFGDNFLFEGDEKEFIENILRNSHNINIFLKEGNNVVGILIARPHNDAYADLKDDDPQMQPSENRYYIETMGVLPKYRGKFGHLKMTYKVIEEARKRGVRNFSMHVRRENGLSYSLQRLFGKKLTHIREIEHWKWADEEPYHYVEGTYNRSLFTLKCMVNAFIAVQSMQQTLKRLGKKIKMW